MTDLLLEWSRPLWLLALPVGGALLWVWWRAHVGRRLWLRHVDAELLERLAGPAQASSARLVVTSSTDPQTTHTR